MLLDKLIIYLRSEWQVISSVPFSLALASLLIAFVLWRVINWFYAGRIADLQGRIYLRDDQIADLKRKEVENNRVVDNLTPRRLLSEQEKVRLLSHIQEFERLATEIAVLYPRHDEDATLLAVQYRNFFIDRTTVKARMGVIDPEPHQTGIRVLVPDPSTPATEATVLNDALNRAGIKSVIDRTPPDSWRSPWLLMVGRAPQKNN